MTEDRKLVWNMQCNPLNKYNKISTLGNSREPVMTDGESHTLYKSRIDSCIALSKLIYRKYNESSLIHS